MKTFQHRQKGYTVEAVTLTADNLDELADLTNGLKIVERHPQMRDVTYPALNVPTPDGMRRLQEGFWLIKQDDNFWVARPGSSFDKVWVEVEDAEVQAEASSAAHR